jgi:glycosyltransferase involved in cell wall biosynthesis
MIESNIIKPVLILQAPLFTQSGYGKRSLDLCKSIMRLNKYDVKIVPTRWGNTPQLNLDELVSEDDEIRDMMTKILVSPLSEQPDVFVQVSIPSEFITPAKFNIGFTAGIETTIPRGEWVEGVNKMDLTIFSSTFSKNVFEKAVFKRKDTNTGMETELKVVKPMEVLFEGVDTNVYKNKSNSELKCLDQIEADFCFCFVGHWLGGEIGHDRKDIGGLVKTFSETFKNSDKQPALILKTSCGTNSYLDQQEVLKRVSAAREGLNGRLPEVYVIHGDLTDKQMNDLYNHPKVKAHVSFTHGEGFGRPLIEASLSGKPVIASNWSGHLDFLPEDKSILLSGVIKQVHPSAVNEWIIRESGWFYVDHREAGKTLVDVHNNYQKYYEKCSSLSEYNKERFSLDKMTEKLKELFEKNIPEGPVKTKLVLPKLKKIGSINK